MKLYKLSWHDENQGYVSTWHPSKDAADKALRALKQHYIDEEQRLGKPADELADMENASVEPVDVPLIKSQLIPFLNRYAGSHN